MKAVVLVSGGLDSTVLLHKMVKVYHDEVIALTMDYGQLHKREIQCAQYQAEVLDVQWKYLDISLVFDGVKTPLLGDGEIPKMTYAEQLKEGNGPVKTYVPNRNMILLSIAAAQAIAIGYDTVAYAAHMDDAAGSAYPDCSPEFVAKMDSVLKTQGISLFAPFVTGHEGRGWTKKDIVAKGIQLHVPFEYTWSCYEGGDEPCGVCGTCRDRIAAFEANGFLDPLMYS